MFKGSTQKWWFVGLTGGLGKSAINFWWMILNMTIKLRSEQPRLTASCRGIHEYCWQNGNFRCNQNGLWFALFGLLICNPYIQKSSVWGGPVRTRWRCEKLREAASRKRGVALLALLALWEAVGAAKLRTYAAPTQGLRRQGSRKGSRKVSQE